MPAVKPAGSGDLLPPSPPAEKATGKPATLARIMVGDPPFYCPVLGKTDGGENDRLGAGAYRGSRRRLRHSISAVGPETPSTKKRPLGPTPEYPLIQCDDVVGWSTSALDRFADSSRTSSEVREVPA